jgi:hypothetical protein
MIRLANYLPVLAILALLATPTTASADDGESPWSKQKKDDADQEKEDAKKKEEEDAKKAEEAKKAEADATSEEDGGESTAEAPPVEEAPAAPASRSSSYEASPAADSTLAPKGGGALGLGFVVGTINGLSLKVWPHKTHGFVLNLGVPNRLNSMAIGISYRLHPKPIRVPDSPVTLSVNFGPVGRARLIFGTAVFAELAGGLAVGVSITVDDVPAEIFFEVAPLFAGSVTPVGTGLGFDVDGLVGARFYF